MAEQENPQHARSPRPTAATRPVVGRRPRPCPRRGHPAPPRRLPLARSKFPAIASAHPDDNPCTGQCGQVGHGVYDASTDPERVRELFAAAPWAAGYGIACGRTRTTCSAWTWTAKPAWTASPTSAPWPPVTASRCRARRWWSPSPAACTPGCPPLRML
ncbi:bifunctional DNA primase/polymerase [Streptacidiphilus monticola]